MRLTPSPGDLETLDASDPLAPFRQEFQLEDRLYFNGNSLGPPPKATEDRIREVVEQQWRSSLIRGWNQHDWFNLPERVGDKIAGLIGAGEGEVVAGDSTTLCLLKLAAAALHATPRREIITDVSNFPTDLYVIDGLREMLGGSVCVRQLEPEAVASAISDRTALVSLTHCDFRSSRLHDMRGITAAAHAHGALALWDLSHSVGALPVDLNGSGVDLAVGCTYKFLNGGPGSPAFSFVARRHHERLQPVIRGWMGHEVPFAMSRQFHPAPGIRGMVVGTPEVIALSAAECSIDLMLRADMGAIREKSLRLGDLLIALVETECAGHGLTLATPRIHAERGSHIALRHPEGYAIMQALIDRGIIGDFRAPDLMRFAITPLYQRYVDIKALVDALRAVLDERLWDNPRYRQRLRVT